jgi:hypothetical protein
MLSVVFQLLLAECCYAERHNAESHNAESRYAGCPYAECHYAECLISFIAMLNVLILSGVKLSVVMPGQGKIPSREDPALLLKVGLGLKN